MALGRGPSRAGDGLDIFTRGTVESVPSVLDVAEAILQQKGPLDTYRLQKLTYYAQAVHLARTERRLFNEAFEAWARGPVSRRLFRAHRTAYRVSTVGGDPTRLTADELGTIRETLRLYGHQSDRWLVRQTHVDEPWRRARGSTASEPSRQPISTEAIRAYYTRVLNDEDVVATMRWRDTSSPMSGDDIRATFARPR